ncbi:hypothetical protein GOV04_00080 [Candidatus Woesearchaeota archaeon]|nr:hypothetical protein [Candidatus Woesearchaeota archaeon]
MQKKIFKEIINSIKEKKTLQSIDNNIIEEKLVEHFKKNSGDLKKLLALETINKKNKIYKKTVKTLRDYFNKTYGIFNLEPNRQKLFEQLKKTPSNEKILIELLKTHKSTLERIPNLNKFYEIIFSVTKDPKTILDLGCGLNPLTYQWMFLDNVNYTAVEINKADVLLLNEYFKIAKIKGVALKADLNKYSNTKKYNVVFAFKVLDMIDKKQVERLITNLNYKWFVATFSTKTIKNKAMNLPYRRYLQLMLGRLNIKYKTIKIGDEIIYLIRK